MLELTKSAIRYSWAMSLFGTQQLANAFTRGDQRDPTRTVDAGCYPVTQAVQNQHNNSDMLFAAFRLVENASQLLALPPLGQYFDLGKAVEAAYALGQFPDLWAVEGLGHDYALRLWGKSKAIRGILTEGQARDLPDKCLTMMHAGLGLAFAQQLMKRITPDSPAADIQSVLLDFVTLVKNNSRKGYEGA